MAVAVAARSGRWESHEWWFRGPHSRLHPGMSLRRVTNSTARVWDFLPLAYKGAPWSNLITISESRPDGRTDVRGGVLPASCGGK
ncbi:hypothetical protein FAIPA1_30133 [Frankia sp. AiPs1]